MFATCYTVHCFLSDILSAKFCWGNCVISIKGTKARTRSHWQRKIERAFAFKVKGLNHNALTNTMTLGI